jgi:hypothetical protein
VDETNDLERKETTMTKTETIKVITKAFKAKHGREPSGRFLWTFRIGTKAKLYIDSHSGKAYPLYMSGRGEYHEKLAAAIECAAKHGAADVSVSSVVYGQDKGK